MFHTWIQWVYRILTTKKNTSETNPDRRWNPSEVDELIQIEMCLVMCESKGHTNPNARACFTPPS